LNGGRIRRAEGTVRDGMIEALVEPDFALPLRIGLRRTGEPEARIEGWNYEDPIWVDLRDKPLTPFVKRDHVVRFPIPEEAPLPQGNLKVMYSDSSFVHRTKIVPAINGEARFTLVIHGDRVPRISADGLIGYYFPVQQIEAEKVPAGEPVDYTVKDCRSAGAIAVTHSNLEEGEETVLQVDRRVRSEGLFFAPPYWSKLRHMRLQAGARELLLSPIPLDRTVRLTVRNGNTFFRLDPFELDEENPFPKVDVRMLVIRVPQDRLPSARE